MTSGRRLTVTINGKPHTVEVADPGAAQTTVTVDGKPYQVRIEDALPAPPVGAVAEAAVRKAPAPERAPAAAERAAGAPERAPAAGAAQIRAPMPGKVLEIAVKPGDRVTFGQRLCALEAMKMNNAIRSPRDGVIAAVEVTEGQVVAHGDLLFTFA